MTRTARKIRAPITVPAIAPIGVDEPEDDDSDGTESELVLDGAEEVGVAAVVEDGEEESIHEMSSDAPTVTISELPP